MVHGSATSEEMADLDEHWSDAASDWNGHQCDSCNVDIHTVSPLYGSEYDAAGLLGWQ